MERDDTRARPSRGPCRPRGGGGGVGSPPKRFSPTLPAAARLRLAAVGAAAVALTALLAAPPAALAQSCTPAGYTGTLPTVAYDGTYTTHIDCHTLTNGLEMTLGPDLRLGTEASPLTERGIHVDAEGDGNEDIVVMGSGTIYTDRAGIYWHRDGTGLLKLEFAKGKIVSGGTDDGVGIFLQHKGEAGQEAKGIHLVSGADIDLSAQTSDAKVGIHATTGSAPADATIPIEIRVTGGTIDVSDPASSTPTIGGSAIKAEQVAKGDIAITVEKAARLGTKEAIAGAYGIEAWLKADSEGDIAITHRGSIHAGTGIRMRSDATSAEKGNITITTDTGSMIVAKEFKEYSTIYENGIFAKIYEAGSTGDVTITHQGDLTAGGRGIEAVNEGTGSVTVTTGAGSQATAGEYGIRAALGPASAGDVTITHQGDLTADGRGIEAVNEGTGSVTVTTGAGSQATAGEYGIRAALGSTSAGNIMLTHHGELKAGGNGIEADHQGTGSVTVTTGTGSQVTAGERGISAGGLGDIKIAHSGEIDAARRGIYVQGDGKGDVTVTTEKGSKVTSGEEGIYVSLQSTSESDLTIAHKGAIDAVGDGIAIYNDNEGMGDVTVTTGKGSKITGDADGIYATSTGDLTITHKGEIEVGGRGIFTIINNGTGDFTVTTGAGSRIVARGEATFSSGINASVRGAGATGDVTVVHGGEITAKEEGIYVSNRKTSAAGTGAIRVTTARGSKVAAEKQGILVWHQGTGIFDVAVRGTVTGDSAHTSGSDTDYAGVHIQVKTTDTRAGGGGKIVLGPMAHLSAKSGTAIKIDERAGAVTVILEKDGYGLAGHLEGKILNADSTTTAFKARPGETGPEMALSVGDRVDMRGATQGVYDKVHRTQLMRITGGHEFKKLSETLIYHDRARVYEALPAVLLDLNGQLPYQERMAAPRDGDGLWARLAAGDGARRPARSTTARDFTGRALAWDVAQYGFEGGLDFRPAATERLLLGVSLHARQGEATVAHGGTIEVSGFGGGGAATYRDAAGFYLDGRFSYTYFDDVDLRSRTRGMVQADLSGHGYALGLEAGKRLGWEGLDHVALTPRARVVWSTVKLEDFADLAGVAGSGRVALETATSLKGRLGVLAETAFGGATLKDWTGDGGRLFGSLDVEHEFSVDRETKASGTALASEVQATWGRVGLGGTLIWTEGLTLSGEGFYATAGSDNTDFGGSLTLTLRF